MPKNEALDAYKPGKLISLEYLLRLLREYDQEHDQWPEHRYEGLSVAAFINAKLGGTERPFSRQLLAETDWPEMPVKYDQWVNPSAKVMSKSGFLAECKPGGLVDYDGCGYPMKHGKACGDIIIKPSRPHEIPEDATHVVWYNR